MIHGLTEDEKFKIVRPILGDYRLDENDMPIIRDNFEEKTDWENLTVRGFNSITSKTSNENTLVTMFKYDNVLERLWKVPLKYVGLFSGCFAVSTPDFTITPKMNRHEIEYNVYRNRWLGVTWQNLGCRVIPAVQWADEKTLQMCLSGIEKGTPVIISTLGVKQNLETFFLGFNEMKRFIEPKVIIVVGDYVEGMAGRFIFYKYEDSWSEIDNLQIPLFDISKIVDIPEYGGK